MAPFDFKSFTTLKQSGQYRDNDGSLFNFKFLLPSTAPFAYIYNQSAIIATSSQWKNVFVFYLTDNLIFLFFLAVVDSEEPDVIDLTSGGNALLGAGVADSHALFFTINHGLVTLTPSDSQHQLSLNQSK